jgi:hypothetical protein
MNEHKLTEALNGIHDLAVGPQSQKMPKHKEACRNGIRSSVRPESNWPEFATRQSLMRAPQLESGILPSKKT